MKAHDKAPVFPDGAETSARAQRNEKGEWILSFDEAEVPDGYIVHEYKVVIRDEGGKKVFKKNFINDYYVTDGDSTADLRLGADTLESGKKYTAQIRAESAYHRYSETVKLEFTAE